MLSHIEHFPIEEAYGLCVYLQEKDVENKMFFRWAVGFQMEMGFDDFKKACEPVRMRSEEDIIDEVIDLFSE